MQHENIALVLRYFDTCNTGDVDAMKATLAEDVVHYFLPDVHAPIRGSEHLSRYWRKFREVYDPVWRIDHAIASGDEVVSEWSCAYTAFPHRVRMMFRGSEWYVIRAGLIAEVRAYYQYDESRDCELNGFPYIDRGYLKK